MSTTRSTSPTRQQLDELDALLQRMLALPVAPVEGEVEVPPDEPEMAAPPLHLLNTEEEPETDEEPAPLLLSEPARLTEPPESLAPPRRRIAIWIRPLVWSNRAFDRVTEPFGATGRWLREPVGRTVVGWLGFFMLLVAGALVLLDWIGWI